MVSSAPKCSKCDFLIPDDAEFCPNCGQATASIVAPSTPESVVCNNCGATVPGDAQFCFSCGRPFSRAPVTEYASTEPPQFPVEPKRPPEVFGFEGGPGMTLQSAGSALTDTSLPLEQTSAGQAAVPIIPSYQPAESAISEDPILPYVEIVSSVKFRSWLLIAGFALAILAAFMPWEIITASFLDEEVAVTPWTENAFYQLAWWTQHPTIDDADVFPVDPVVIILATVGAIVLVLRDIKLKGRTQTLALTMSASVLNLILGLLNWSFVENPPSGVTSEISSDISSEVGPGLVMLIASGLITTTLSIAVNRAKARLREP